MRFLPQMRGGGLGLTPPVFSCPRGCHPACGRIARLPSLPKRRGLLDCTRGSESPKQPISLANHLKGRLQIARSDGEKRALGAQTSVDAA